MSESNHTPGPWQVSGGRSHQDTYGHTIGPDGLGIACVFYSDRTNADHIASLADARLIAQAWKIPDLEAQIASLTSENERLRALVKDAYGEGWSDCTTDTTYLDDNWKQSATYAALQPNDAITPLDNDTEEDIEARTRYWLHKNHCNVGEYEGSCKYGDDDCPELAKEK